jgi:hypothetical protein
MYLSIFSIPHAVGGGISRRPLLDYSSPCTASFFRRIMRSFEKSLPQRLPNPSNKKVII